jgi:hypothetical protein
MQDSGGTMTPTDFLTRVAQLELNQQHIGLVGLQQAGVEYICRAVDPVIVWDAGMAILIRSVRSERSSGGSLGPDQTPQQP